MSDAFRNNRPAPSITFADVVLNSFALLLLFCFWLLVLVVPIACVVTAARVGVQNDGLVFILLFMLAIIVLGAVLALGFLYLAKKICERRRWSILASSLITIILAALLITSALKIGLTAHLGLFASGLTALVIALVLFVVALAPARA
ncbi:phosphoglycerol transferase MdoB-like AlkP superfamily enzyme [Bradyrhizobium sp. AZCC 1719]|uniref:hypothetical protein n=1 Tax=Bradyrhizobium sp. AZCC 1719 TaxID=3117028 RepID=UPI002FF197A2